MECHWSNHSSGKAPWPGALDQCKTNSILSILFCFMYLLLLFWNVCLSDFLLFCFIIAFERERTLGWVHRKVWGPQGRCGRGGNMIKHVVWEQFSLTETEWVLCLEWLASLEDLVCCMGISWADGMYYYWTANTGSSHNTHVFKEGNQFHPLLRHDRDGFNWVVIWKHTVLFCWNSTKGKGRCIWSVDRLKWALDM